MNSTRTTVDSNSKSEKSAASRSWKSGQPLRKFDAGLNFGGGGIGLSDTPSGFDLSRVPARPSLRTSVGVQCCAKDGMPCSCPTCQEKSMGDEVATDLDEIQESPSQESAPEQSPVEASSSTAVENPEATSTETTTAQPSASPLIVDDSASEVSEGQMKKGQFIEAVRAEICRMIEPVLAGAGQTSGGCPFLASWMESYQKKDVAHIEQSVRKYAPGAAGATTAAEYISAIGQRAVQMVQIWASMGMLSSSLSDVPGAADVADDPDAVLEELAKMNVMQEKGADGANSQKPLIQTKAKTGGARHVNDPAAIRTELGDGQPLNASIRSRMESAFGQNFSHVRTHTDSKGSELSNRVNARAFTVGEHIAFGSNEYQPESLVGNALIAHELAHVVQQGGNTSTAESGGTSYNALEDDADRAALGAVATFWNDTSGALKDIAKNAVPRMKSGLRISRCEDTPKDAGTQKTPPAPAAPAAAKPPKLTKKNDGGPPTSGDCGKFNWVVQWVLDAPTTKGGWIIQKVESPIDVKDCKDTAITDIKTHTGGRIDPSWYPYWEAWPVNKNQKITTYAEGGDTVDDTFSSNGFGDGTKGNRALIGTPEFHDGLTLPSSFKPTGKPPTGILPTTKTDPGLTGTGTIPHKIKVDWNCCPDPTTKTVKDKKSTMTSE